MYRKPELEQYRKVWITQKVYKILRAEKRKQKKSMARIVQDVIEEKYGDGLNSTRSILAKIGGKR